MDVDKYLDRIGVLSSSVQQVDTSTLKLLHRSQVRSIPFEALNVHLKRPITLSLKSVFEKVVLAKQGGFCYELNYLFCELLITLGYKARLISARIFNEGKLGPPYDHMAILVSLERDWLVDVGYGDLFIEPLCVNSSQVQQDQFKNYKVERLEEHSFILSEALTGSDNYANKYLFDTRACKIEDFSLQCQWKQSDPASYFVKNLICTRPTLRGRKTILNSIFKERVGDETKITTIADSNHLISLLKTEFDISGVLFSDGFKIKTLS